MEKTLYFVDSIFRSSGEAGADIYVNLIGTKEEEGLFPAYKVKVTEDQLRLGDGKSTVEEGMYVFYEGNGEDEHHFTDGSADEIAISAIEEGESIRRELESQEIREGIHLLTESERKVLPYVKEVYSYHVNVGHGNCSLILLVSEKSEKEYVLWMVDCSIIERVNMKVKYQCHISSLQKCLDDIGARLGIQKVHIDRFFLTHMHYDHYSGVNYLLKNNYVDDSTIYCLNHYYDCNSKTMVSFLKSLKSMNALVIEPVVNIPPFRYRWVNILHPECRIYKKGTKQTKIANSREVDNANNASVVYCFSINGREMVFPGDLENEGFVEMMKVNKRWRVFCETDYYVVSHHGSITGHPLNTKPQRIPFCLWPCRYLDAAIIMGRDGAYNGIFSQTVMDDFKRVTSLHTTDANYNGKSTTYLRIDWKNNKFDYV